MAQKTIHNNVFFLISIIFGLTILLTGIIVAYFNILIGLIINVMYNVANELYYE